MHSPKIMSKWNVIQDIIIKDVWKIDSGPVLFKIFLSANLPESDLIFKASEVVALLIML